MTSFNVRCWLALSYLGIQARNCKDNFKLRYRYSILLSLCCGLHRTAATSMSTKTAKLQLPLPNRFNKDNAMPQLHKNFLVNNRLLSLE